MKIEAYYEMVESCIQDMGIKPEKSRGINSGQWDIFKGNAHIIIEIISKKNEESFLQCLAPIIKIPKNNVYNYYEEVLKKKKLSFNASLTKLNNWIYVKSIREIEGIDKKEMNTIINKTGAFAEELEELYKNNSVLFSNQNKNSRYVEQI